MARTSIEGGAKFYPAGSSSAMNTVDTAGWGVVTILGKSGDAVTVTVGDTSDGATTSATTTIVDPKTGAPVTTFPTDGCVAYVGFARYVKTASAVLLTEAIVSN